MTFYMRFNQNFNMADGETPQCICQICINITIKKLMRGYFFSENISNLLVVILDANPVWWGRAGNEDQQRVSLNLISTN